MQECKVTPAVDEGHAGAQDEELLFPANIGTPAAAVLAQPAARVGVKEGSGSFGEFAIGAAWGLFAISIWAGWFIVTRVSAASNLTAYDLVALRYGVTLIVLLPFIIRIRSRIALLRPADAIMIALGSGATYSVCITVGVAFAPAAEGAALTPGVMPLLAALISVVMLGESYAAVK